MMHPDTEIRHVSDTTGLGVFATKNIPRGTIVYVKDPFDICVTPIEFLRLEPRIRKEVERFSYTEPTGDRVLSWDLAKYVNHSCNANTMSTGWGFEIAVADIQVGDQITDEYGLFNLSESMMCDCGASDCRGVVSPCDIEMLHESWDDTVEAALQLVNKCSQPLLSQLDPAIWSEVRAFADGRAEYRSVLELCPPNNVYRFPSGGEPAISVSNRLRW